MSTFLHQIFYANNKFGSKTDDISLFIEESSKWSIPQPIYITQPAIDTSNIETLYESFVPSVRTTEQRGTTCASRSVGVRGFACEAGVSGWRVGTPSGDGLPSKDNNSIVTTPFNEATTKKKQQSTASSTYNASQTKPFTASFTFSYDGEIRPERRMNEDHRVFYKDGSPSPEDEPSPVIPQTPTLSSTNMPHYGVLTKSRNTIHPKIPSKLSIFQSVFILHYGYSEYMMAGNRMLNRELEEKQKIMETLSKMPKKLKEGNHKLTNDNIQEILSGLLVATKEEIMHLVAYSTYYKRIIYLVFTHSYLVFSPTKEVSVDASNIKSVYILNQTRKHPKYGGSYYPDLEPTLEKVETIHNSKIHLEHYAKPFRGVSAYKLHELEDIAKKTGIFEKDVLVKYKKKELYDKIVEVCCAGICA